MIVRTRIAPSPTGFPHIGTVYQALFDWAYAHRHQGQFIVRIEDTDQSRFVVGAEDKIYAALDWFGLGEDESPRKNGAFSPYKQSERLDIYKKYAEELVEKGYAYYCTKKPEELEILRQQKRVRKLPPVINEELRMQKHKKDSLSPGSYVIRMRIPDNERIIVNDGVRGEIVFDSNLIDDQVILKSDGFPTYHLAVVVDDYLMKITHILRGEEWINSTPKHILLYRFFGWEPPLFFHTSLLRNPDKTKMSKRHAHASVDWYKEQGYLPDAILNYLAHMAWRHPKETEIFSLDEFVQVFDFADMKAVGPAFDLKKLEWMNGEYLRATEINNLKLIIENYLKEYGKDSYELAKSKQNLFNASLPLIQERIKKLSEYWPMCSFFFTRPSSYELSMESYISSLKKTIEGLQNVSDWNAQVIGESMQKTCESLAAKKSDYFMMMRVAITGHKISPPLNESMELLGKDEVIDRLRLICG
ncbi:MAG: glutamate--tRNA ligase [Candidatus Roizmanbacteria bacterium]